MLRRTVAALVMMICLLIAVPAVAPGVSSFHPVGRNAVTRHVGRPRAPRTELDCLARAVYYEAATEGPDGWGAVATVVFNRMTTPGFPHTVCAVVYSPHQFSWTDEPNLRPPNASLWKQIVQQAQQWLRYPQARASLLETYGDLTYFHAGSILPSWAQASTCPPITVGSQMFYHRQCVK